MARARLHIICGNCGCNSAFNWEIVPDAIDTGDEQLPGVYIRCDNCSTLHSLHDYMPQRNALRDSHAQ